MSSLVFSSEFLQANAESICETVAHTTYGCHIDEVYRSRLDAPFRAGLKAGDNGAIRRINVADRYDIAETFGYTVNDMAQYCAFELGFVIALMEGVDEAVAWFVDLDDDGALNRIASERRDLGEDATADDFREGSETPQLSDALLLAASYNK